MGEKSRRVAKNPLISVIIPCYNSWEYLPQCIQSLEQQTIGMDNLELIFVDDASTDGGKTWACIQEFEQRYPNSVVAIHLDENRSQGGARNVGMEYARADYIGFVDSDDWIDPEMYKSLYECICEHQCDVVECRMVAELENGTRCVHENVPNRYDEFSASTIEGDMHWIDVFKGNTFGGGVYTKLYKRKLILENRLYFPEHVKYEDNYWINIMLLHVRKMYHIAKDFYHYRENSQSTIHLRNNHHHFDRLDMELKKVEVYKELQVYDRFEKEIERDFLEMYYCNTLTLLWTRFDDPPYDVFCKMQETVQKLFPDYRSNPYFQADSVNKILISLIGRKLSREQFVAVGNELLAFADEMCGAR